MKKFALSLSTLLCFSLIPALAHAESFTFTPTGGTAYTFTTGATSNYVNDAAPYDYVGYNTAFGDVVFFGVSEGEFFDSNYGYGPTPFDFSLFDGGTEYLVDGVQLFTGTVNNPQFIPGIYDVVGDQAEGNGVGGVLVIGAATPEPSSFILLGTGVLGAFGAARRRFVRA